MASYLTFYCLLVILATFFKEGEPNLESRCSCKQNEAVCINSKVGSSKVYVRETYTGMTLMVEELIKLDEGVDIPQANGVRMDDITSFPLNPIDDEKMTIWSMFKGTEFESCTWGAANTVGTTKLQSKMVRRASDKDFIPLPGGILQVSWIPNSFISGITDQCYSVPIIYQLDGDLRWTISTSGCHKKEDHYREGKTAWLHCTSTPSTGIIPFNAIIDPTTKHDPNKDCMTSMGVYVGNKYPNVPRYPAFESDCLGFNVTGIGMKPTGRMVVLPVQKATLENAGLSMKGVGHGWTEMSVPKRSKRSVHDFIKCCGFLLGVGGLWWQIDINLHGMNAQGAADVDSVNKALAQLTKDVNGRFSFIYKEIAQNKRDIYNLKLHAGVVDEAISKILIDLNMTAEYNKFKEKVVSELLQMGYCQESEFCYCPPEYRNSTNPPPIIPPTAVPVQTSSIVTWVVLGLVCVVLAIIATCLCKFLK